MRFFKYVALALLGLMVLFAFIGLFLPSAQHVEREITVAAPAAEIFPYTNDFHKFIEWSPWAKLDPDTKYTFSGASSGVGAKMQWASEHEYVGHGSQEILESIPDTFLKSSLDFGFGEPATASFTLSESDGQTTVVWAFDTYMGNTITRYFGLMLDQWVGAAYEQGLSDLKLLVESR
jgi:hypothetical protein